MAGPSVSVEDAVDVSTINRLLEDVVRAERRLQADLVHTVMKKEHTSRRLEQHETNAAALDALCNSSASLYFAVGELSTLAHNVSEEVRQLDVDQCRVEAAIARVSLNGDMASCVDGITSSLEDGDFEAAAGFVESLAKLQNTASGGEVLAVIEENKHFISARDAVAGVIREKFNLAADENDTKKVFEFGRLFPKLQLSQEGLLKVCVFLQKVVRTDCARLQDTEESSEVGCAILLAHLFRSAASCIGQHGDDLLATFGPTALDTLIHSLNKECDFHGSGLLKKYMDQRNIFELAKHVSLQSQEIGENESSADPREIEEYLEEIVSICQIHDEYNKFLSTKSSSDKCSEEKAYGDSSGRVHSDHQFKRCLHDLLGFYIRLEEYYMLKSVSLAIGINEQGGSTTSSLVDDVFYILQQCSRRASETLSIQAICAVLNHANLILTAEVLRFTNNELHRFDFEFLEDILSSQRLQNQPSWATAINNSEVIADNIVVLVRDIEEYIEGLSSLKNSCQEDRIKSCLQELKDVSSTFRTSALDAIKGLTQSIQQRLRPAFEVLSARNFELSEDSFSDQDDSDPWVQHLLLECDQALCDLRPFFVPSALNSLIAAFAENLANRLEGVVLGDLRFTQLGGLLFERSLRRIVFHFTSCYPQSSCRESFARVSQVALILTLEDPSETLDYWDELTFRLSELEVKRVLNLRSDFRVADINALHMSGRI